MENFDNNNGMQPRQPRPQFTPERIENLLDDEIFVFGSNLAGCHGNGAARLAVIRIKHRHAIEDH